MTGVAVQPFESVVFAGGGSRCFWLAGFWRGRGDVLPWTVAAGVAVAAKWWLPGTWYIVLGAVTGSLIGAWREKA